MFCNSGNCNQISSDVIELRQARIQDIVRDRRNTIVTVSYIVVEQRRQVDRTLSLIVNQSTLIVDQNNRSVSERTLRVGMSIDALVSTRMTRSIPPQTRAIRIVVNQRNTVPQPNTMVRTGRILQVNTRNQMFTVGVPWHMGQQMRFVVSQDTIIRTPTGRRVGIWYLIPGMNVRVEHSDVQTASIPPQSVAFVVQILN